jgi:hypothetical protein
MLNFWCGESPMRRGIASLICFFAHCESSVDWRRLTGRHPAPHLIKNDDSCKAHFGGLFLWAKKSPHGFMQARQLHLDFVPVYVFCPEVERYCLEYIL